jgi:hypothetical protein
MRTAGRSDRSAPRGTAAAEQPATVREGLGLADLVAVLEALGSSELARICEVLGACDTATIDAASAWLRARSRAALCDREARRARAAVAATADPFARMLLRREAVAAARDFAAAEAARAAAASRLTAQLGPARAGVLQRALARVQDLASLPPLD